MNFVCIVLQFIHYYIIYPTSYNGALFLILSFKMIKTGLAYSATSASLSRKLFPVDPWRGEAEALGPAANLVNFGKYEDDGNLLNIFMRNVSYTGTLARVYFII